MSRRALAALGLLLLAAAARAEAPPEPQGYRLDQYRAPTPATLAGATVVTAQEAAALWRERKATFIDVLPQPPRPANLAPGTLWRPPPRESIPGAVWLPNVGFGEIAPSTDAYFRHGLERATSGDPGAPLVFFCLRACWMSWNAAKRALSYGYADVRWMPDGTDGWRDLGLELSRVEPLPDD